MTNKILIIDDDKDICEVLQRNLSKYKDYRIKTVNSGAEALKTIKRTKYDLILLDLKLPDIYGTDLLKEIRKFEKDASVIVLTGYPSLETAIETLKTHASDYILKPFKVEQLRSVIERELLNVSIKKELGISDIGEIGKKIKELRKKNHLSLDALAAKTQLSKSFLSEVERKKKFPRLSTVQNIARQLGVDIKFFFKK